MRDLNQKLRKGFPTYVKSVGGASWTHSVSAHLAVRLATFSIPLSPHTLFSSIIHIIIHNSSYGYYLYPSAITYNIIMTHVYKPINLTVIVIPPLVIITGYRIILHTLTIHHAYAVHVHVHVHNMTCIHISTFSIAIPLHH